MESKVWICTIDNKDVDIEFLTRDECVEYGIEESMNIGLPHFKVGYKRCIDDVSIDVISVIESMKDRIKCMAGISQAESFLSDINEEKIQELGEMLNKSYSRWKNINDINPPTLYVIEGEEEIRYCAHCRREITDFDLCSDLIYDEDDSNKSYYFHKSCKHVSYEKVIDSWRLNLAKI